MDIQVREREPTTLSGGEGPKPSSRGGLSPEKLKIVVAVTLFVLAGIAVAWQFGLFSGGPKYDENNTPLGVPQEEEQKMWEDAQRERERIHPPGRTPPPSGS